MSKAGGIAYLIKHGRAAMPSVTRTEMPRVKKMASGGATTEPANAPLNYGAVPDYIFNPRMLQAPDLEFDEKGRPIYKSGTYEVRAKAATEPTPLATYDPLAAMRGSGSGGGTGRVEGVQTDYGKVIGDPSASNKSWSELTSDQQKAYSKAVDPYGIGAKISGAVQNSLVGKALLGFRNFMDKQLGRLTPDQMAQFGLQYGNTNLDKYVMGRGDLSGMGSIGVALDRSALDRAGYNLSNGLLGGYNDGRTYGGEDTGHTGLSVDARTLGGGWAFGNTPAPAAPDTSGDGLGSISLGTGRLGGYNEGSSGSEGRGSPGEGNQGGGYSGAGNDRDAVGGLYKNGQFNQKPKKMAIGGIATLAGGGTPTQGPRLLRGGGDGLSDGIPAVIGKGQPARLADGEFVVSADAVSSLGGGSTEAGARKLYAMMDRIRQNAHGTKKQVKKVNERKVLPA